MVYFASCSRWLQPLIYIFKHAISNSFHNFMKWISMLELSLTSQSTIPSIRCSASKHTATGLYSGGYMFSEMMNDTVSDNLMDEMPEKEYLSKRIVHGNTLGIDPSCSNMSVHQCTMQGPYRQG